MTKKREMVLSLLNKSAMAITLTLAATASLSTSAFASAVDGAQGTFRTAVCGGTTPISPIIPLTPGTGGGHSNSANSSGSSATTNATADGVSSSFITLIGNQAAGGFGLTSAGAQLTTDGTGGTAALNLRLTYPTVAQGDTSNDFLQTQINYKTNNSGSVKADTSLVFCFQANDGTGDIVRTSVKLNKATQIANNNGFNRVVVGNGAGLNVGSNMVLRKLSIQLSNDKNKTDQITIGEVQVYVNAGLVEPVGINLTEGSCKSLSSCPSATTVED